MTTAMPHALRQAVDAINNGDTEAFVAAFAKDGVVDDWGRVLRGHDGVRSWAKSDAIGAGAKMTIVETSISGSTTTVVFDWTSRVFNGRSHAYVTIAEGLIREFRIPSN